MKKQNIPALILILSLVAPVCALGRDANSPALFVQQQQQQQSSSPQKKAAQDEDDVVRINTNLVQVDAVVTDKSGRPVTDLRVEDFEVLEDGKPQPITNFLFVPTDTSVPQPGGNAPASAPATKEKKGMPPPPPVRLRPEQVRHTFAVVVDDVCMSALSTQAARDGLRKFVNEQMQPNDLVAIFRTRGGSGALQQFTSDKRQLLRGINSIRWLPGTFGANCQEIFEPERADYTLKSTGQQTYEDPVSRQARERREDYTSDRLAAGTLGSIGFVIRGLQDLPGRKAAVLISDGLPLFGRNQNGSSGGQTGRAYEAMQRLVDQANRASVVIYTMDARGLVNPDVITAEDDALPKSDRPASIRSSRSDALFESRNGLSYLAAQTGGIFIHDKNFLDTGFRRVVEDQRGYYLLAYKPSSATFADGTDKFRKITVRLKRPDLRVRSRSGFYGVTTEAARPKPRTGDSQLYTALASPLTANDVRIRLASFFGNDQRTGSFMRALLYIDARDITFTDDADGSKKLVLDVAAVTFDKDGKIVDEFNRTHTIHTGGATFQSLLQNGLVYSADVPVKKPGAYQFRMVVRDTASKRLGSASQFIEVPDLKSNDLALSGIILGEARANAAPTLPPGATAEAALAPVASQSDLAVRIFHPGAIITYNYLIYNPRLNAATHQPKLTTQLRLYREGQLILDGPETPLDAAQQKDLTRLTDDGGFRLKDNAAPGEYVLQLTIKDAPDGQKPRTASQYIDFEVVK